MDPTILSGNNRRIVVIGTSCSGKTSFARKIAEILKLPHIELDAIHWKPGWEATPEDEFRILVKNAIQKDEWIVDGNYSVVRDIVWSRATILIWLNLSFNTIFLRALKRTIKRIVLKEELFSSNRETLKSTLLNKDSIPLWVIKTYWKRRRKYPEIFREDRFSHLKIIELKDQRDVEEFISKLKETVKNGSELKEL